MFIGMGVRIGLLASAAAFSPSSLFAASEPGVWYDPSDLTTLFQDTAGTVPVTAAGQSVALVLDKSKGLALGSELVTNGDFSNGSTGWTVSAQSSISGGQARIVSTDGSFQNIAQSKTLSGPAWYQVSLDVVSVVSGSINFSFTGAGANITVPSGTGRKTVMFFVASSTSSTLSFGRTAGVTDVTIDNISVRELPGNHATQATAASRPIYARNPITGTRNLLTYTEQFDNAVWTKTGVTVTANAATDPIGGASADKLVSDATTGFHRATVSPLALTATNHTLSVYMKAAEYTSGGLSLFNGTSFVARATFDLIAGTVTISDGAATIASVGNGWYRCTVTGLGNATITPYISVNSVFTFAGTAGNGIYVWGAQLEAGSTATAYQKVVSQYDVTQSGVADAYYLAFDGVDDFLVTPTITPGIDKAQVFAGVRKLSDASAGVLVESSASWYVNNGAFSVGNPATSDGFGNGYFVAARANSPSITVRYATTYSAPITNVVSALFDLAASAANDKLTAMVNGAAPTLSNASAIGTGNFLAYPLYIGRRGGTTLPFNGRIYSLITRFGANLTATQITNTETWVNGKTGAY